MPARPTWEETWAAITHVLAKRATCPRAKVGCLIVSSDNHVLSSGWNGAPSKAAHCEDLEGGCLLDSYGHCVSGDTVISKFQTGSYNTGHLTVREIEENWQHPRKRGAMRRMNIRAVTPQGMIVPDRVVDIWKTGTKETFTLISRFGRKFTATEDHRVLTPEGWIALGKLRVGSEIALNGLSLINDPAWLRQKYEGEGLDQLALAGMTGVSRQTVRRRLEEFGIPIRPFQLGGWNTGITGESSHSYKEDHSLPASSRAAARRYNLGISCLMCDATEDLQVHHIDLNPLNNEESNLCTLCIGCHNVVHTPHAKIERVVYDTVISIEYAGKQEVYDLETEKYHNFIGDGVALHNCARSVHAEMNAIAQAAKRGTSLNGCTVYLTLKPCLTCTKALIQVGARQIFWENEYSPNSEESQILDNLLKECGLLSWGQVQKSRT